MFISNVHTETKPYDIECYIQNKTDVSVSLKQIKSVKHKEYNAYKFFIPQEKECLFLDEKIWPRGIIFRRFVHFNNKSVKPVNGRKDVNNG